MIPVCSKEKTVRGPDGRRDTLATVEPDTRLETAGTWKQILPFGKNLDVSF